MIKISANPLVIAAALGLLGPAALADDDEEKGLGGIWERADGNTAAQPARLGQQIQLLPMEGSYLLDEGTAQANPKGTWQTDSGVVQTFPLEDTSVSREFESAGDDLHVRTVIVRDEPTIEYTDVFPRISSGPHRTGAPKIANSPINHGTVLHCQ